MTPKTDIVYVLGKGSNWANREIWYSLASVDKNLKGVGQIFVVGENPGFLSDKVKYIKVVEQYDPQLNPAANIITKLLAAADNGLAENFLLMNDDFVILQQMNAADVPVWHKGKFSDYPDSYFNNGNYRLRMQKTFKILQERKLPDYNFGVHIPMPINTAKMKHLLAPLDWKSGVGISFRTLYGNLYYTESEIIQKKDPNVNDHHSLNQLKERFADKPFMSYNDKGLNRPLKAFLKDMLPEEHKYCTGNIPELPQRQTNHKRISFR
jgi:hypothetical protein